MEKLKNKVALVTGAGSGIGASIAKLFALQGAQVLLTDVNEEGGHKVLDEIKSEGGTAAFFKADVSKAEDAKASVEKAKTLFGALHIACNNAGISGASAPIGEIEIEDWEKVIGVNLNGVFYGMRYQIPAMLEAGGGAIVNIASILSQVGFKGSAAYVTAKHGVVGLTKNAGLEYGAQGIRVNAVGPAFIKTPLLEDNLDEDTMKMLEGLHSVGRMGQPDEVAHLVLWLSSDDASFANATYYPLDGGYLAQ